MTSTTENTQKSYSTQNKEQKVTNLWARWPRNLEHKKKGIICDNKIIKGEGRNIWINQKMMMHHLMMHKMHQENYCIHET